MIGIILIGNIEYSPYLEKYTNVLKECDIEYEVLYWDRENLYNQYPKNYFGFRKKSIISKNKAYKIIDFFQYSKWLKKQIANRKYDKLIILGTLTGFLTYITLKNYKNKYIFDIRDFSYENITLFYNLENRIIQNSFFTCISSEGFKKFLPTNNKFIITHNFNYKDLISNFLFKKKKQGDTLNFVWLGSVRYYEHQKKIIYNLKNDKRFNIIIHGTGPDLDRLKLFCKENNINNIKFTGRYNNSEKFHLLYNADLLNNSYDINIGSEVKYAISNKFYDGIIYRIPQLVEENTYKNEKIRQAKIGIALNINHKDFADELYKYYFSIDENQFNFNCNKQLELILKEDKIFIDKLKYFILK